MHHSKEHVSVSAIGPLREEGASLCQQDRFAAQCGKRSELLRTRILKRKQDGTACLKEARRVGNFLSTWPVALPWNAKEARATLCPLLTHGSED